MKLTADSAFVLHCRRMSDSKIIIKLLTRKEGALSAVLRSGSKRAPPRPFVEMEACWSGRSDLKNLRSLEELRAIPLLGRAQFCGLYLNELLYRLMPEHSSSELLYDEYVRALRSLGSATEETKLHEVFLRRFEFTLLKFLGVGIHFGLDELGNQILAHQRYVFAADRGLWAEDSGAFLGETLLQIESEQWDSESLKAAKRISRAAIEPLLGGRPLRSRELFVRP
jgi:DNA repair protein RecO (recombination protein O)